MLKHGKVRELIRRTERKGGTKKDEMVWFVGRWCQGFVSFAFKLLHSVLQLKRSRRRRLLPKKSSVLCRNCLPSLYVIHKMWSNFLLFFKLLVSTLPPTKLTCWRAKRNRGNTWWFNDDTRNRSRLSNVTQWSCMFAGQTTEKGTATSHTIRKTFR